MPVDAPPAPPAPATPAPAPSAPAPAPAPPPAEPSHSSPPVSFPGLRQAVEQHHATINRPAGTPPPAPAVQPPATPSAPGEPATPPPSGPKGSGDPLADILPTEAPSAPVPAPGAPTAEPEFLKTFDAEFPEQPGDIQSPKGQANWKSLRQIARESKREAHKLRVEREQLEGEVNKLKGGQVNSAELETLRGRVADFEKRDAVFKLENDPQFQERVLKPLNDSYVALDKLIETYKVNPEELRTAFNEAERTKRNAALSGIMAKADMNDLDKKDFTDSVTVIQDMEIRRQQAYADAQKLTQAAEGEIKARQEAESAKRVESLQSADDKVWDSISNKAAVFKDILADNELALDVRRNVQDKWLKPIDRSPEAEVFAGYASFLMKPMQAKILSLQAELDSYKQRVSELTGGEAPAGGGAPSRQPEQEPVTKPGQGVGDAVAAFHAGRQR